MTRRAALIGTTVLAIALMWWGAVPSAVDRSPGPGRAPGKTVAPAVIPVRVVLLNPSTGAVVWSSVVVPTVVVLNPGTGGVTSTGSLPLESVPGRHDPGVALRSYPGS